MFKILRKIYYRDPGFYHLAMFFIPVIIALMLLAPERDPISNEKMLETIVITEVQEIETVVEKAVQVVETKFIIVDTQQKILTYEKVFFEVTAYTAGFESCGKLPSDPLYGHTALSGRKENNFEPALVQEWQSIAAPWSIPFGTKLFIPAFEDMANHGLFIVDDRGGAIKEGRLDIYMSELSEALKFGRQELEVWIIEED